MKCGCGHDAKEHVHTFGFGRVGRGACFVKGCKCKKFSKLLPGSMRLEVRFVVS